MITNYKLNKETGEWIVTVVEDSRDMTNVEYGADHYAGVVSPNDGYVFKGKKDYNDYLKKNDFVLMQ